MQAKDTSLEGVKRQLLGSATMEGGEGGEGRWRERGRDRERERRCRTQGLEGGLVFVSPPSSLWLMG